MNVAKEAVRWIFKPPIRTSVGHVVVWWEARRIPYNLFVGILGVVSLLAFYWAISTSGYLRPGEDAVEPLALLVSAILVNLCYTLGWLVEVPARIAQPSLSPRFGPLLLKVGIVFSAVLVGIPAVVWLGIRLLQMLHVR